MAFLTGLTSIDIHQQPHIISRIVPLNQDIPIWHIRHIPAVQGARFHQDASARSRDRIHRIIVVPLPASTIAQPPDLAVDLWRRLGAIVARQVKQESTHQALDFPRRTQVLLHALRTQPRCDRYQIVVCIGKIRETGGIGRDVGRAGVDALGGGEQVGSVEEARDIIPGGDTVGAQSSYVEGGKILEGV